MIPPFRIDIPDKRLAAIMAKVNACDWSQFPDAGGWKSGVGIDDLKRLVRFWQDDYDWRKVERRLNLLPHYTTDVEGERIHFVHVKGDGSKPPLLLLHGWPGSFLEFEGLLEPLVADGHDVVVPSLPGFSRREGANPTGHAVLQEIQRWVIANPAADATTDALAARAGLSSRHFVRLFKHEVGMTPATWVENVRIERARQLLESGERPKQAAAICGFTDIDTFRRAFQRQAGVTPAEYRRRYEVRDAA